MHITVATLLALQCTLCYAIRVPSAWNDQDSAVNKHNQFPFVQFAPQNVASSNQKPIPTEYFQYTAQKPKFAVDIAKLHGVQSPGDHFKANPIKPHTGIPKPVLGKHQIQNQVSDEKNAAIRVVSPSSSSFEVFHPYKLEEPALKELYHDPVMKKIKNDLENNKIRLQKYEIEAGKPNIVNNEYKESPEETDRKKVPHKNAPAPYEIHRPQHRPVYYRPPPVHNQREQVLNQKLKHPWQQNYVKVKPLHYGPVKNHLQKLRQQHALKYDDEQNEYPQLPIPEKHSEPPEGYDIYEKGKETFEKLRDTVDESLNEAIQKNRPPKKQKLELDDNDDDDNDDNDEKTNNFEEEDEFVPIKNYAQVRKTETTKHLPKEAAYDDADTLEEIQNAPRLREAIKSSKAQTVYSEEGYEDSAYDHAGEQKHASDHEEHRGSLKQKENSNGNFKLPTLNIKYKDERATEYHDQVLDGKKWQDIKKNTEKEKDSEEYVENEQENSDESDNYDHESKDSKNNDNTAEDETSNDSRDERITRIKREPTNDDIVTEDSLSNNSENVPNLDTKLLTSDLSQNTENINNKYPYYHNKFKEISKDSPLRYAENLKLIPNKTEGGSEFYDSRAKLQCPEVEDNIDPIPEKLKKDGHPDDDEDDEDDDEENIKEIKDKNNSDTLNQLPRLNGLGDKIDCFKAKYFGKNPLDSPFFKEEIISNPEPLTIPSIDVYRLKQAKQQSYHELKVNDSNHHRHIENDVSISPNTKPIADQLISVDSDNVTRSQVISHNEQNSTIAASKQKNDTENVNTVRRRRAAPFVYEPYKTIRDSQIQDSKKTTTTNNISPLIKQLQSSRVVDKVIPNAGKEQIVKRSAGRGRPYKDIGKNEREKNIETKGSQPLYDASFVDVNVDQRRGEPRYELRSANHNLHHSPAKDKRSMSVEDHKLDINSTEQPENKSENKRKANRRRRPTTARPYFDVSKFLPQEETHQSDPVNIKSESPTKPSATSQSDKSTDSNESKEHNIEGEDAKKYVFQTISTTTAAPLRKKVIDTPTTVMPDVEDDLPKLRLITRFQNSFQTEKPLLIKRTEIPGFSYGDDEQIKVPKYREKKKKVSKSTLVTDTNSYGEDDDDDDDDDLSKEEEVDALIGVKHDNEEYLPTYDREVDKTHRSRDGQTEAQEGDEDYEEDDHTFRDEDEENDEEDDSNDEDDENDDNEDDDDDDEVEDDEETEVEDLKQEVTTSEPTKRTLVRTTEEPSTTTEARSAKLEIEPVIVKKKLDIHKELPVNRSSPHITEFKQDIKEIEIIKEIPSRNKKKPQKNIEALELYKDENLAKDINKLGGVEVFKEGLDLINGPKHGGNYRSAETLTTDVSTSSSSPRKQKSNSSIGDVVAAPSKTAKTIEIKDDPYSRRRNDIQRARNNRNRNAKIIELSDATENPTSRPMHGGNFRSIHDMRRRGGTRNSKIIELVDQPNRDDHSTNKHDANSRSYGSRGGSRHQMHGGNYRSAKLINDDDKVRTQTENAPKDSSTDGRQKSAVLLNSFARAVSVLTTPTPYILDPSKRMYYFVEA